MSSPIPELINNIELRVLQGPQAGAVLPLTGEDILIGSDQQCDVILQSPTIALRHAQLSVTDNDFSITALDGQIIASAGAPAAPPWQFGTAIYLGDVSITIDRNAAEWSAAPPPQAATDDQSNSKSTTRWQTDLLVHWKRFALLGVILVSLSVAAQVMLPNQHRATAQSDLSPENINSINALIANHDRNGLLKLDVSGKKATVRGFLPSKIQINALHRDLSKWRKNLDIDVQAEDILLAASRHFLIQEHSPLKVTIVDGQARLSGRDARRADVNRLAQDLKKNVSGLAGVNATFVDRARLEGWLRTWWRQNDSASNRGAQAIQVVASAAGDLELRGALSLPQSERLQEALTRRSLQKDMLLAVRIAITTPSELSNKPPNVRAFSAGAVPYVFLTTGKRLIIGGAVDGFQLVAINEKGPVFEKQGGQARTIN